MSEDAFFLYARGFEDCLERAAMTGRRFGTAIVFGCPAPSWLDRLSLVADRVEMGLGVSPDEGMADLVILLGSVRGDRDSLALLRAIRHLLADDGMLVGSVAGAGSLERLQRALLEADRLRGRAVERLVRLPGGAELATMLAEAGFDAPVVEVDRLEVRYDSLDDVVKDLREMRCFDPPSGERPPLSRSQRDAARRAFLEGEKRVSERFDLLQFTAFASAARRR